MDATCCMKNYTFICFSTSVVFLLNNPSSNAYGENSSASWKGDVSVNTQKPCLGFSCTVTEQENGKFEFTYDEYGIFLILTVGIYFVAPGIVIHTIRKRF